MSREKFEADSYLRSGTNELKILEYSSEDLNFGINILKTSRVLSVPDKLTSVVHAHPSVKGLMNDHGTTIPIIDLAQFLHLRDDGEKGAPLKGRIIVTEFFGQTNGFLIDKIHYVHTILWDRVFDSGNILGKLGSDYVIGIVRPNEDHNILLLDYEKIFMELSPQIESAELKKVSGKFKGGENQKVLIAEDSAAVRDMLAVELSSHQFEVLQAKDGKEALALFEQNPDIVLVISDIEMPQMDGLSLTKRIKEKNPDVAVIVYSSIGDPGMKERARSVMADAHITKLNLEELSESLNRLLAIEEVFET